MKLLRRAGSTSHIFQVFIRDSSSTTGAGLTGLAFNTASLVAYYHRNTDTTATAISLVTMTVGSFTSGGFKEIDATNMPGWYQFCPPDAASTTGATSVGFHLKGATNMAPLPIEVDLDGQVDVYLWNGTAVSSPATAGIPDVNAKNINNVATTSVTTVSANVGTTQPTNFTGTGASALVKGDAIDWAGTAITATSIPVATAAGAAGGLMIAGSNAATTWATGSHLIGTVDVVTAVTNQLTAAAIATGVWTDTTAGDFTVALSVGKSVMNGVSLGTGLTVNAVTTVNGLASNVITAASIAASALNGKGDWNTTTPPTVAAIATGVWQDSTAGDFTTASSIGKSLYNAFTSNTSVFTVAALANAPTGGSAPTTAQIATAVWQDLLAGADFGTAGSIGALLKTDINAPIGSIPTNPYTGTPPTVAQIATAVWQDATGSDFTAASSIGKSLYTTGNAPGAASGLALVGSNMGTVTTCTNLTNAPTAGDFTATMKTSIGTAVASSAVASVTGNVAGSVGSVTGAVGSVTGNVGGNVVGSVASVTAAVTLNPAQAISSTQTDGTLGAALLGMEAQSVGKWTVVGTTLTLYRKDGVTVVRTFTLDSASAPTSRT